MSLSLDILPLSSSLDFYGEPDPSSAYSLSGYVSVTLRPSFVLFDSRRTTSLLLQSLELVFEGQSEVIAPSVGYSALRLCSISRELAPEGGLELNSDGHGDSNEPCRWNFVFSIPIPGWLPESTTFGADGSGTSYTLYANARVLNVDDGPSSSWLSMLCFPFRSRSWTVSAAKSICIKRYVEPPSAEPTQVPNIMYLVKMMNLAEKTEVDPPPIPLDIISKIHIIATIPSYVNIDDREVTMTVRLRTKGLCEADCQKLNLVKCAFDLVQQEKCRYRPTEEYQTRYPLPSESQQPPRVPLRSCHRLAYFYDYPLQSDPDGSNSRTLTLLPSGASGFYPIVGNTDIFANDAVPVDPPTWYTMEVKIPMMHNLGRGGDADLDWAGRPEIRPTLSGPLYGVCHEVRVSLTCTYDLPDSEAPGRETLGFFVPVKFVRVAPSPPLALAGAPQSLTRTSSPYPSLPPHDPYVQTLPPYSQLFYSNGDRKIDSTPLPRYTPRNSDDAAPVASTSDGPLNNINTSMIEPVVKAEYHDDDGDNRDDGSNETTRLLG